ncbi:MAG: competence protein TfoX [Calditrichaeota bacterium]|nr:MAG: competence protein TfoX [Calditrichota bacterium]
MASDLEFVQFVVDQIESNKEISYRKMFGGITLYCNSTVVGLICDNKLFIKITNAGKAFVGEIAEGSPYPGAKPAFQIEDEIEDRKWISTLIEITENELPIQKPKKNRKNNTKK